MHNILWCSSSSNHLL